MQKLFIPNAEYHGGSGFSNSGLSEFKKSPYHFWWTYLSGQAERTETPAMKLGTAVHSAILEPELFESEYVRAPQVDRRTKEGKDAWAALPEHKIALRADEWDQCVSMRNALRETKAGRKLLNGGEPEASYFVEIDELMMKCRPDYVTDNMIIDVKTTDDASPMGFMRSAVKFGYHRQAALYMDILAEFGTPKDAFVFAVVEKSAPYATAWYYATQEMIDAGRAEYKALVQGLKTCLATGNWPGYGEEIKPLKMPEWYK